MATSGRGRRVRSISLTPGGALIGAPRVRLSPPRAGRGTASRILMTRIRARVGMGSRGTRRCRRSSAPIPIRGGQHAPRQIVLTTGSSFRTAWWTERSTGSLPAELPSPLQRFPDGDPRLPRRPDALAFAAARRHWKLPACVPRPRSGRPLPDHVRAGIHPPGDGAGRKRKVFTNSWPNGGYGTLTRWMRIESRSCPSTSAMPSSIAR